MHPSGVAKSSTSFGWGKGWNVTSAGWQVTLCDLIWHVYPVTLLTTLQQPGTLTAPIPTRENHPPFFIHLLVPKRHCNHYLHAGANAPKDTSSIYLAGKPRDSRGKSLQNGLFCVSIGKQNNRVNYLAGELTGDVLSGCEVVTTATSVVCASSRRLRRAAVISELALSRRELDRSLRSLPGRGDGL